MEAEAVEFMIYLKRNVTELKRLGSEWGMSETEINSCIDKALEAEQDIPVQQSNKLKLREIWLKFCRGVKLFFKVIGIILAVLVILLTFVSYHEDSSNYIGKALQPYGYPLFRLIRLATLPIHKILNITYYYDSECLIENPFFQEPQQECDICQDTKDVMELRKGDITVPLAKRFSRQQRPFVYRHQERRPVSFEDLVAMYEKNKDVLDRSVNRFQSSDSIVTDLASLFGLKTSENLMKRTGFSVHWDSRNMASSQILRKMFPRPEFVPPDSEVALEKIVYIDGPLSQQYEINGGFFQAVFVNVVKGKRKAVITSVESCSTVCSPLHVDLNEGDILVFGPSMWRLNVMPNIEDTSILYVGSFTVI